MKLGWGEREVLEFIVEQYSDYQERIAINETVANWVAKAKQKLEEADA